MVMLVRRCLGRVPSLYPVRDSFSRVHDLTHTLHTHTPAVACMGPGIARGKIVTRPVPTMDLAATFLDFGHAEKPKTMSSVSLRPLMQKEIISQQEYNRPYVSSGLDNWRMVVESDTNLKFICCKGTCPGAPKNVPDVDTNGWQQVLYNVSSDPFDMNPLTSTSYLSVMSRLRAQLPASFGCGTSSIFSQEKKLKI
jgi:hypothetical protein